MTISEADSRESVVPLTDSIDDEPVASATTKGDEHVGPVDEHAPPARRSISIGLRTLVIGVVIAALVAAVAAMSWLYFDAQRKLDAQAAQSENYAHAERVAMDYAVNAAAMNFQDLSGWKVKLVAGTSPELKDKLSKAATSMEQILVPLQWVSTARPLVAKVRSQTGGTYVVDSFVSVETKTTQAPDPLQSTATYSVTIDSGKDWQITDIGGIGNGVGQK
jgi:Mce-associated membrane protein